MTKEEILDALKAVKYPPYSKDIVSFGMVKYVKIDGKKAEIKIFTGGAEDTAKKVVSDSAHELSKKFPDCEFNVSLLAEDPSKKQPVHAESSPEGMSGAKFTIAVASGKGGVGKSTVAVNLARALAERFSTGGSAKVGLMDCDIHGPSATILFGEKVFPSVNAQQKIIPPQMDGIKTISMGMLVDDSQPLLWRGPMVTSAIKQFAGEVEWGELDAMVLDLTTPNELAATTAVRGAAAFDKSGVKILGVIENMAYLQMPDGTREYIFGEGYADDAAKKLGTEILARIPIDKSLHTRDISEGARNIFRELSRKIIP